VYKCPTLFHESSECRGDTTFARGPKYGWMVCTRCGKPTRAWAEGDGWYTSLGTNMLPVTEEAGEYRGYGVPGHYWDKEKRAYVPYGRSHPLMGGQAGFASKEEGIATGLIKDGQ
jgi:hypothetical protein